MPSLTFPLYHLLTRRYAGRKHEESELTDNNVSSGSERTPVSSQPPDQPPITERPLDNSPLTERMVTADPVATHVPQPDAYPLQPDAHPPQPKPQAPQLNHRWISCAGLIKVAAGVLVWRLVGRWEGGFLFTNYIAEGPLTNEVQGSIMVAVIVGLVLLLCEKRPGICCGATIATFLLLHGILLVVRSILQSS